MRHLVLATAALLVATLPALAQHQIGDSIEALPAPVVETWSAIHAAAVDGSLKTLRSIGREHEGMQLGFGGAADVAQFTAENSLPNDEVEGISALIEVLEAPYAVVDNGQGSTLYIWPYLAAVEDISALTRADRLEAYQLVRPEELDFYIEYGGWIGLRTIIRDDGSWSAIVAGD